MKRFAVDDVFQFVKQFLGAACAGLSFSGGFRALEQAAVDQQAVLASSRS